MNDLKPARRSPSWAIRADFSSAYGPTWTRLSTPSPELVMNAGKFCCRRLSASFSALASCANAPTCTPKRAAPGVGVIHCSGATCVGASSIADLPADTSPTGVVATACGLLFPNVRASQIGRQPASRSKSIAIITARTNTEIALRERRFGFSTEDFFGDHSAYREVSGQGISGL